MKPPHALEKMALALILAAALTAGPALAAPSDAIATADPGAVDATAVARMVDLVEIAMQTSTPHAAAQMMVDAFIQATRGAAFPRDATGNLDPRATVNLSKAWPLFQQMTASVCYMALRNSYNAGNHPGGLDRDLLEWGLLAAPARIPSATLRDELRNYHLRGLRPPAKLN